MTLLDSRLTRRSALTLAAAAGLAALVPGREGWAQSAALPMRPIPSTGERIPIVGLGTWITFNVGNDAQLRQGCTEVMRAFFAGGGRVVDSSPMYGSSQPVVGQGLKALGMPPVFAADKVWVSGRARGVTQMEQSRKYWGVPKFDLLQVHNLLDWEEHLPTLFAMKAEGKLRYVGITTSHGRRHEDVVTILRKHPVDFLQITYNPVDREVEQRILPLAKDRGIAVIINRPLQEGALTERLKRHPLPALAKEVGAQSWAQLSLKFILSHPAVTSVIPATTRVDHMRENLAAAQGALPEEPLRRRIAAAVEALG